MDLIKKDNKTQNHHLGHAYFWEEPSGRQTSVLWCSPAAQPLPFRSVFPYKKAFCQCFHKQSLELFASCPWTHTPSDGSRPTGSLERKKESVTNLVAMGAIHALQDSEEKPECMCSFHHSCINSMYFHTYLCLIDIFCSLFFFLPYFTHIYCRVCF